MGSELVAPLYMVLLAIGPRTHHKVSGIEAPRPCQRLVVCYSWLSVQISLGPWGNLGLLWVMRLGINAEHTSNFSLVAKLGGFLL
jgi:hypothetical protein